MRIFENKNIRKLFFRVLLIMVVFYAAIFLIVWHNTSHTVFFLILFFLLMSLAVFVIMYLFFKEQDKIIEQAVSKIKAFISGDKTARIICEEEGELFRLFHEVNMLASTLAAYVENENREKQFMKDTISDISHQLKTPIAALNVYNGIMQEETEDLSAIKEFASLSEKELDRMEYLVKNLLKITKLDAGTVVFNKRDENISNMMQEKKIIILFFKQKEKKRQLHFQVITQ